MAARSRPEERQVSQSRKEPAALGPEAGRAEPLWEPEAQVPRGEWGLWARAQPPLPAPVSGGQSAPLKAKLTSEDARIAVSPGQSPSQSMTPGRPQAKKGRMSLKRDPPLRKWSWTSSKLAPSLSVADGANAVISESKSYIVERLPGAADEENRHLQRQGLLPVPRDHQSPRGGRTRKARLAPRYRARG